MPIIFIVELSQYLPTGGFEWVDLEEAKEAIDQHPDAEKGYILEVDHGYPEELYNMHKFSH